MWLFLESLKLIPPHSSKLGVSSAFSDDPRYNVQMAHFWKNVAMAGAAVSIAAGAGKASMQERSKREKIAHAIEEKMAWFPWPEGLTA